MSALSDRLPRRVLFAVWFAVSTARVAGCGGALVEGAHAETGTGTGREDLVEARR